jgi:hypothetical protein
MWQHSQHQEITMPVVLAGFVKNRAHQFGRQTAFGTTVAAKRRYAMKGVPAPDPQWTDPDVDLGSVYTVAAPNRMSGSYPASLTIPTLHYNDLPLIHSAFFGGGVVATGGPAWIRLYAPSATEPDEVDPWSYEFFDDTGATDGFQFRDGVVESFEITGTGKGALSATLNWQFGAFFGQGFTDYPAFPTIPTALTIEPNEAVVYMADLFASLASSPYDLGYASRIENALHAFTLRGTKTLDRKEFANGDHSFDVDAWGTASVMLELEATWAKTTDIIGTGSESDAWMSTQAVDRYVGITAETDPAQVEADTGVPYLWDAAMPMRYYTRTEGDMGGNATVVLTGHGFADLNHDIGPFQGQVVNTLADADF